MWECNCGAAADCTADEEVEVEAGTPASRDGSLVTSSLVASPAGAADDPAALLMGSVLSVGAAGAAVAGTALGRAAGATVADLSAAAATGAGAAAGGGAVLGRAGARWMTAMKKPPVFCR
jgi:hypothetical protein